MIAKQPCFGVMVATCDRLEHLRRAIGSLAAQSYENWLAVVVDDSIGTETSEWFATHRVDPRITYVRNPTNLGVGPTRNRALDSFDTRVDFVARLDDDDWYVPTALENAAGAIRRFPDQQWFISRHLNGASMETITQVASGRHTFEYWSDILRGDAVQGDASFFISRHLITNSGARFPEHVRLGGEWRFFAELSRYSSVRFFEGGETCGEYLAGGLSDRFLEDLSFFTSELLDMADVGRTLELAVAQHRSAENNLTGAVLSHIARCARRGSIRTGAGLLKHIDYRTALGSKIFYLGIWRALVAMTWYRFDSGAATAPEQFVRRAVKRVAGTVSAARKTR